jgi:ankyrin repeat protein
MQQPFVVLMFSIAFLRAGEDSPAELLTRAARAGDVRAIESFLDAGADPNLAGKDRHTALFFAVLFNRTQVVELLLAHHANPNPAMPLQFAADAGNLRIASMLIRAGADIDAASANGRTALHHAVLGRHLDVMQLLIEKGADVTVRDATGTSPLDDAVWGGSLDAAAILLAHGARLNEAQSKSGATPLNEAAYLGEAQIVRYLLQFRPDLEAADKRGYTPLDNAIRRGKERAAVLLLEAEPRERQTPEFFEKTMGPAIRKNEAAVVEALLRQGAPANGALLEDASLLGFDAIASALLDHGAPVDRINDGSGTTALYAAASFGKAGVAEVLLKGGANPSLCGRNRKTPYQAAFENGYLDVASRIRSHGGAKSCGK